MRVVIVGATGNVGTSVVSGLSDCNEVESVIGLARRLPALVVPKVEWRRADITDSDLAAEFAGADAVVHLAWAIQPSRDSAALRATNVGGSIRVLEAVAKASVPILVYASSVGAYSPGFKDRQVDESWPTGGIESSFYSRHKAEVESLLDEFDRGETGVRVVRMRPALIFKRDAATEIRRLFLGPFVPRLAFTRRALAVMPDIETLRFQAVHTDDVADAVRRALLTPDARGPFNLAADPVLDPRKLSEMFAARRIRVQPRALRGFVAGAWHARLQPSPPGWLDMALRAPLMSSERAERELDWKPRKPADAALVELLQGLREGAGLPTPPLDPRSSGPLRIHELRTGVGARAF